MLLGLELVNITIVPVIVWFVFGFVVALGLEIYLRFSSHRSQPKTGLCQTFYIYIHMHIYIFIYIRYIYIYIRYIFIFI